METPTNVTEFSEAQVNEAVAEIKESEAVEATGLDQATSKLSWKEHKSLKKNGYFNTRTTFDETYVIENTKTKKIVALNASSAFHASTMIGWKSTQTRVLDIVKADMDSKG